VTTLTGRAGWLYDIDSRTGEDCEHTTIDNLHGLIVDPVVRDTRPTATP